MITTKADFYQKLASNYNFNGETINLPNQNLLIQHLNNDWQTFTDCTFICERIDFKNISQPTLIIEFRGCSFNCSLFFSNSSFNILSFLNTKLLTSISVTKGLNQSDYFEVDTFKFSNNKIEKAKLKTDFYISNIVVKRFFSFTDIKHVAGRFEFFYNNIGESEKEKSNSLFANTTFSNAFFSQNTFHNLTTFFKSIFIYNSKYLKDTNSIYDETRFYKNTFSKVNFNKVLFFKSVTFDNCDFLSTVWFENCNKNILNNIVFQSCKFEKYSLFDNSIFNRTEILHSKFLEKVSFNNFETIFFNLHQVSFSEAAYFDDLNKNNSSVIENWDRKTLRAIKRELINTHNQIDYLRFKAYELEAYKKEKGKSWKDSFILFFNEQSNYFGLDWFKGLKFTLYTSFICYLLYIITFAIVIKSVVHLPNSVEDFFVNYLKFLNPFSFLKSPVEESEKYFFPFLFFIIGKIFVSYGIYQTAQAFRKFGVNGG